VWPRLVFASGPEGPPERPSRTTPPPPEGADPPRPRAPFELSPGLRTTILFGLGLGVLGFEFFIRPFLGLEPNALAVAAGLTLLGLPLFLGLPGGPK
jgi:hypothetical protein